ncbi:MAG: hypothetical protein COA33_004115 [Fluviicola sp.]|nr:hypothetical protein [Fluviicola sp.]
MKFFTYTIFPFLIFAFSACIEIIDDITINDDGSGTFKYTVNLSSSKVKINSILALDSLDGKKVPSLSEIQEKLHELSNSLRTKEGISNVDFHADYDNFIFKIKCDFTSLSLLQNAVEELAIKENKGVAIPELKKEWLTFENDSLVRSVPKITLIKAKKINKRDAELLKEGSYTSITRFQKVVDTFSNNSAKLSKNRKAVMVRTNPYLLIQNPQLVDNVIYLEEE